MADGGLWARLLAAFWPDGEQLRRGPWRTVGVACVGYLTVVAWPALGATLALSLPRWAGDFLVLGTMSGIAVLGLVGARLGGHAVAFRTAGLGAVPMLAVGIFGGLGVPDLILATRGHTATAVVVGAGQEHNGKGVVSYDYVLRTLDGHPIAGLLETGDGTPRATGSRLSVVLDPAGLAPPEAGDVHQDARIDIVVTVCGLVLLAALIGWTAASGYRCSHERQRTQQSRLRAGRRVHGNAVPGQSRRRRPGRRRTVR